MGSLDDIAMLDELVKICEVWRGSKHRMRSSHAMVKINKLIETRATESVLPFPDRVIP